MRVRWIASIPRKTARSMPPRRCCTSTPWSALTAVRACRFARCRPSSRSTICRKSGTRLPSATPNTSGVKKLAVCQGLLALGSRPANSEAHVCVRLLLLRSQIATSKRTIHEKERNGAGQTGGIQDPDPAGTQNYSRFRLGGALRSSGKAIERTGEAQHGALSRGLHVSAFGQGTRFFEVANCHLKFKEGARRTPLSSLRVQRAWRHHGGNCTQF